MARDLVEECQKLNSFAKRLAAETEEVLSYIKEHEGDLNEDDRAYIWDSFEVVNAMVEEFIMGKVGIE